MDNPATGGEIRTLRTGGWRSSPRGCGGGPGTTSTRQPWLCPPVVRGPGARSRSRDPPSPPGTEILVPPLRGRFCQQTGPSVTFSLPAAVWLGQHWGHSCPSGSASFFQPFPQCTGMVSAQQNGPNSMALWQDAQGRPPASSSLPPAPACPGQPRFQLPLSSTAWCSQRSLHACAQEPSTAPCRKWVLGALQPGQGRRFSCPNSPRRSGRRQRLGLKELLRPGPATCRGNAKAWNHQPFVSTHPVLSGHPGNLLFLGPQRKHTPSQARRSDTLAPRSKEQA